jgi:hypothetical protein
MELTTKQYNQVSIAIKKYLFKRGIFLSKWDFEDNLSNIEKINIRSREEFEKSISNFEFIKEYNELLKKL